MKRLLFTLAAALVLIGASSFRNDDGIAPAALQSFQTSFKSATAVNWTAASNHYKATFVLNGQYVFAYYDLEGKLLGVARNISSVQLPVTLQSQLKSNYSGYWITDLFETTNDDGTTYFITLENADTQLVLQGSANDKWAVYKKQRKS